MSRKQIVETALRAAVAAMNTILEAMAEGDKAVTR